MLQFLPSLVPQHRIEHSGVLTWPGSAYVHDRAIIMLQAEKVMSTMKNGQNLFETAQQYRTFKRAYDRVYEYITSKLKQNSETQQRDLWPWDDIRFHYSTYYPTLQEELDAAGGIEPGITRDAGAEHAEVPMEL